MNYELIVLYEFYFRCTKRMPPWDMSIDILCLPTLLNIEYNRSSFRSDENLLFNIKDISLFLSKYVVPERQWTMFD